MSAIAETSAWQAGGAQDGERQQNDDDDDDDDVAVVRRGRRSGAQRVDAAPPRPDPEADRAARLRRLQLGKELFKALCKQCQSGSEGDVQATLDGAAANDVPMGPFLNCNNAKGVSPLTIAACSGNVPAMKVRVCDASVFLLVIRAGRDGRREQEPRCCGGAGTAGRRSSCRLPQP
jgi:hypothetical protein